MAETKAAFRRRVGRILQILRTGTTSGTGTTTTFIAIALTDYYPADDSLNGASVYDVAASEWRRVTDWVASTGTGTVNRAYTNSQASARSIEVYEQFTPQDVDDAILMAMTESYPYVATRVVNESLVGIANQYEYTVPSTIRDLERTRGGRVQWQINTATTTFPYADAEHWDVRTSGSAQTLTLPDANAMTGRTIRLIGWGVPSFPATDATSIDLEEDVLQLLAFKVAEIAWRTGPRLTGRDAEFAQAMSSYYGQKFDEHKDTWGVKMVPGKLQPPEDFPYVDSPLAYFHSTPS